MKAMKIQINCSLRIICLAIGLLHVVFVLLRIYERIWELIILEEPFLIRDHATIVISYVVQLLIASLLIYGCIVDNPNFTVPWLILTTPIFAIGTIYALLYLVKEELSQNFYNIFSLCCVWTMWWVVIKYNFRKDLFACNKIYKFSQIKQTL